LTWFVRTRPGSGGARNLAVFSTSPGSMSSSGPRRKDPGPLTAPASSTNATRGNRSRWSARAATPARPTEQPACSLTHTATGLRARSLGDEKNSYSGAEIIRTARGVLWGWRGRPGAPWGCVCLGRAGVMDRCRQPV